MTYDKDKSGLIDPGGALRNSYRDSESAIDVITNGSGMVPSKYNRVEVTRNSCGQVTEAVYYDDNVNEISKVIATADVSGSLNNKYFVIYSGRDGTKYHVWFNVNGAGSDPAPASSTAIEVTLSTNDVALVVATAIKLVLDAHADFSATLCGNEVLITAEVPGVTTDTADVDTNFTFNTNVQGSARTVRTITFTYDSCGNLLTGDAK